MTTNYGLRSTCSCDTIISRDNCPKAMNFNLISILNFCLNTQYFCFRNKPSLDDEKRHPRQVRREREHRQRLRHRRLRWELREHGRERRRERLRQDAPVPSSESFQPSPGCNGNLRTNEQPDSGLTQTATGELVLLDWRNIQHTLFLLIFQIYFTYLEQLISHI